MAVTEPINIRTDPCLCQLLIVNKFKCFMTKPKIKQNLNKLLIYICKSTFCVFCVEEDIWITKGKITQGAFQIFRWLKKIFYCNSEPDMQLSPILWRCLEWLTLQLFSVFITTKNGSHWSNKLYWLQQRMADIAVIQCIYCVIQCIYCNKEWLTVE